MTEEIKLAVLAERKRCADIAIACSKASAIEVNGETHLLGVMMSNPAAAQYATAFAIFEAIDAQPLYAAPAPTKAKSVISTPTLVETAIRTIG